MWSWLETSGLAQWIQISPWAYPTLLSAHGLGMGVVVGLTSVVALRILGFPKGVPLGSYQQTLPYLVVAFIVNAASGTALFVADASNLASNTSFQIKLAAIALGLVVLWRMYGTPVKQAAIAEGGSDVDTGFNPTGFDKGVALFGLLLWMLVVITSGRLIAYLSATF